MFLPRTYSKLEVFRVGLQPATVMATDQRLPHLAKPFPVLSVTVGLERLDRRK
jgi:hypothetical protein